MGSILEYIKSRASSTFLVSYTACWAILHWEGIYVTFFVSEENILARTGMLKNQYIAKYFFGIVTQESPVWAIVKIFLAFGMAYFYVWWLPKILVNPSYKMQVKYKTERKIIKMNEEKRLLQAENKKIKQETEKANANIELRKKKTIEKNSIDAEMGREYNKFCRVYGKNTLIALKRVIYNDSGYCDSVSGNGLPVWDSNGLTEYLNNRKYVRLTEKGKYFIKRLTEDESRNVTKYSN